MNDPILSLKDVALPLFNVVIADTYDRARQHASEHKLPNIVTWWEFSVNGYGLDLFRHVSMETTPTMKAVTDVTKQILKQWALHHPDQCITLLMDARDCPMPDSITVYGPDAYLPPPKLLVLLSQELWWMNVEDNNFHKVNTSGARHEVSDQFVSLGKWFHTFN